MTHMPMPPPIYGPPVRPPKRMSPVWIVLIILGSVLLLGFIGLLGTCMYVGAMTPSAAVIPGRQLEARFETQIRGLGVIDEDERIKYFYSDALLDIEDGFYLLTNRKLLIYRRDYSEPALAIKFDEIADLSVTYDTSMFGQSLVGVTLEDDSVVTFPLANEGGGDAHFYEALSKRWKAARAAKP